MSFTGYLPTKFSSRECWKKPPAAFSPFCRAHVLWVRSARQKGCGLAGRTFLNIPSHWRYGAHLERVLAIDVNYSTAFSRLLSAWEAKICGMNFSASLIVTEFFLAWLSQYLCLTLITLCSPKCYLSIPIFLDCRYAVLHQVEYSCAFRILAIPISFSFVVSGWIF